MAQRGMKFGIFLAPFHRLGENPTLAMARDMELVEWLDWLGYDEAWIGEHHSAGWEIIASPEIFIAQAADRTRHIKLGSGVTSLPYHHPFLVAQRFVQLDHITRGRVMLGCGPGQLFKILVHSHFVVLRDIRLANAPNEPRVSSTRSPYDVGRTGSIRLLASPPVSFLLYRDIHESENLPAIVIVHPPYCLPEGRRPTPRRVTTSHAM